MRSATPRRHVATAAAAAVALLAALLVAACTGGTDEATPEPAAAASGFRVTNLDDLSGYRFNVQVTLDPEGLDAANIPPGLLQPGQTFGLTLTGAALAPDREQSITTFALGDLSLAMESVRVGDRMWTREGDGPWRESAATDAASPLVAEFEYRPSAIFRASEDYSLDDLTARLGTLTHTMERVNGHEARRYTMTPDQFREVFQSDQEVLPPEAGPDATFIADLWFAEALGAPLRMVIVGQNGAGQEILRLEMDMTDLNAPDIAIEPPA
ncbi:MAG: hypothetical protein AMXMBFR23_22420 [Chloroflexota bacterium]